jgi:hypothetical protein
MTLPETNPSLTDPREDPDSEALRNAEEWVNSTEPREISGSGALMWPSGAYVMGPLAYLPGRTFGPHQVKEAQEWLLSANECLALWLRQVDSPRAE